MLRRDAMTQSPGSAGRAPLVSVCMPLRDQARYVRLAIESVLGQTLPDFELIVIDDASTDGSGEIAQAVRDSRVHVYRRQAPGGVATVRNACLEVARGDLIAWLDADDLYEPDALETLGEVLRAHPGASMAHGGFCLIDGEGNPVPSWEPPFQRNTIERGAGAFAELAVHNYVTTSTVMVQAQALRRVGAFDPAIGRSSTDWNMWLRLALQGDVAFASRIVAAYRRHAGTITASTDVNDERLLCDQRAVEHALCQATHLPDTDTIRVRARTAQAFRWLVRCNEHLREGRRRKGLIAAMRSWRLLDAAGDRETRGLWMQLLGAALLGDEYGWHLASRGLMRRMHVGFEGTRYGKSVEKLAVLDADWLDMARSVAARVKDVTSPGDRVAVIDKHDPTILHYSERNGRHFPELPGMPRGTYPSTSAKAIDHLECLRRQGIGYFVVPRGAFWWLDYYSDFRRHLDGRYRRVVSEEHVVVFSLFDASQRAGDNEGACPNVAA